MAEPHAGVPANPISPTPRQRDLLLALVEMTDANGGVAPSREELARRLNLPGKGQVARLVDGLVERGWIRRVPFKARGLVLLHRPSLPNACTVCPTCGGRVGNA